MRIIAGKWRGRKLVAPKGDATRPTADRVREALFSMLASRLGSFEGLRVADIFAGSGALGLEALSRGAAHCIFVEREGAALDALRANIASLGADAKVIASDAFALPTMANPVQLAMLDPPYAKALVDPVLIALRDQSWLGPGSLVSVETSREDTVEAKGFESVAERAYGKTLIRILRLSN